jgi:hypothetical protein
MSKTSRPPASSAPSTAEPSREARCLAAMVLEVLAGARTTADAATVLGLSLVRYYQLEAQALRGLLAACEPRPKGRVPSADSRIKALQKEQQRLERELARQQALVRLSQRALGLPPASGPAAGKTPAAGQKKKRRPLTRALGMARRLQADDNNRDHEASDPVVPADNS